MNKIKIALDIAKLVIFLALGLKSLILEAEEFAPESGKGAQKFAAVKAAVVAVAGFLGIADEAIKAADKVIDERINSTVSQEINS